MDNDFLNWFAGFEAKKFGQGVLLGGYCLMKNDSSSKKENLTSKNKPSSKRVK